MPLEVSLLFVAVTGAVMTWIVLQVRLYVTVMRFYKRLRAENPLFSLGAFGCQYRFTPLTSESRRWRECLLTLTTEAITLYPLSHKMGRSIGFPLAKLRWFGRPVKYHDGRNELWLHFEQDGEWKLVKLRLRRHAMQDMVRSLKSVTPPKLITAYRRQRPYIHQGPVKAQPAEQDIYGAWTLDDSVSLYVMPLYVVILRGREVLRLLPLERIWQIAALRRLDAPEADGLVSLNFEGEKLAYAVKDYEGMAAAISEAAKRSLEEPVMQKQKKKDEYDDEEWE